MPVGAIRDQGYDLSINRYNEDRHEVLTFEPPMQIIQRMRALEVEVTRGLSDLEKML